MMLQDGAGGERLDAYITITGARHGGAAIEVAEGCVQNDALLNHINQHNAAFVRVRESAQSIRGFEVVRVGEEC